MQKYSIFSGVVSLIVASVGWATESSNGCPSQFKVDDPIKLIDGTEWTVVSSVLNPSTSDFLKQSKIIWPIGVGAIIDDDGNHVATATLVSEKFILTVAHGIAASESLKQRTFVLGEASQLARNGALEKKPSSAVWCFALTTNLISSVRGYLDYALIEIKPDISGAYPSNRGFTALPVSGAPVRANTRANLLGQYGKPIKEHFEVAGLAVISAGSNEQSGRFEPVRRYTKDGGTAMQLDYWLHTEKGHSGSPILDDTANWIGMHQRNLNLAKCENHSPWSPYVSEYYFDHFGGGGREARVAAECQYYGLSEPNDEELRKNGLLPKGSNLPRQGTLLTDIAVNVERRLGSDWMCENVPQFLALLKSKKLTAASCSADEYTASLKRLTAE